MLFAFTEEEETEDSTLDLRPSLVAIKIDREHIALAPLPLRTTPHICRFYYPMHVHIDLQSAEFDLKPSRGRAAEEPFSRTLESHFLAVDIRPPDDDSSTAEKFHLVNVGDLLYHIQQATRQQTIVEWADWSTRSYLIAAQDGHEYDVYGTKLLDLSEHAGECSLQVYDLDQRYLRYCVPRMGFDELVNAGRICELPICNFGNLPPPKPVLCHSTSISLPQLDSGHKYCRAVAFQDGIVFKLRTQHRNPEGGLVSDLLVLTTVLFLYSTANPQTLGSRCVFAAF